MIKLNGRKRYIFGILLTAMLVAAVYYVLRADALVKDEIVFSPSSSDELSDEELKTTLDAAKKNDMSAVSILVSHYGNHLDTPEGVEKHHFWLEILKDEARKGNPEAKKHFLDGNPD